MNRIPVYFFSKKTNYLFKVVLMLFILVGMVQLIQEEKHGWSITMADDAGFELSERQLAQIIIRTPIITLPTFQPTFIIQPTLVFGTPTPTFTPTATPTPTPIPELDIGFHGGFLNTDKIVHSINGMNKINGSYELIVQGAPANTELPIHIHYELLNSANAVVKQMTDTAVLSNEAGFSTYLQFVDYEMPVSVADALALDSYRMRISVDLIEDAITPTPPEGHILDENIANNQFTTAPRQILHTSGRMVFGDIETYISELNSFSFMPINFSGVTQLFTGNSIINVPYNNIRCDRNPTTLDLTVTNGVAPFSPNTNPFSPLPSLWIYQYTNAQLRPTGAFSNIRVRLPECLGYRETGSIGISYQETWFALGEQKLLQTLQLASDQVYENTDLTWSYDSLGFNIKTSGQFFNYNEGFVLENPSPVYRFDRHFNAGFGPGVRASNCGYLQGNLSFDGDVSISPNGIIAQLNSANVNYQSSFPYKVNTNVEQLALSIVNNEITQGETGLFEISVNVNRSDCSPTFDTISTGFTHTARLFADGSVVADSDLLNPINADFNTFDFSPIASAAYYQPGIIMPKSGLKKPNNPAEFLQAMRDRNAPNLRSYANAQFENGVGLFAGLNVMPETTNGMAFTAQIDTSVLDFTSTQWTKLYARYGGFSGVVDAESAGQSFEMYADPECGGDGYQISLTSFGQAYLDNDSEGLSSTIDGEINIPWPSGIVVPFEDMTLNGCGNFTGGNVPSDAQKETKTLAYWSADLRVLTFAFPLREGATDDSERTLWISSKNTIANLQDEPLMQTNIRPCGSIRDSKIEGPMLSKYDGYTASVQKIYLSNWDGGNSPNGFYNIISDLVVAFFNPPKVHIIVRGLVGEIVDGDPWFSGPDPDTDRDGFPTGVSISPGDISSQFAEYVDEAPINVNTKFANLIDLNYEVAYNKTQKEFRSTSAIGQDLIVIDIESEITYLNYAKTEVTFGIEVAGIPDLNLSSAASQFTGAIQDTFLGPVRDKLDDVSGKLTGDLTTLMRPTLKSMIKPHVQAILNQVQQDLNGLSQAQYAAYAGGAVYQNHLNSIFANADFNNLLRNSNVMPVVDIIDDIVTKIEEISQILQYNPNDLAGELGPIVQTLLDLALSALNAYTGYDLNQVLQPLQDAVSEINQFLQQQVLPPLQDAQAFFDNPTTYLDSLFPPGNISTFVTNARNQLQTSMQSLASSSPNQFRYMTADQITDHILNSLFNTQMFQNMNNTVVSELFPIKDALMDAAQEILDNINDAVEDFIKENLGDVIEGAISEIKDTVGFEGASMKGYAIISGDIMEKLHIDAEFSMSIPDKITYAAYLDMTRYNVSNSGKNCFANIDDDAVMDCRIGAKNISLGFAGADITAEIIELKLMIAGGSLVNVGGTLQTKGSIGFETVAIIDPSFGVAVGLVENYFWASVGVKFESYSLKGGVFFGTSCTLEPLEILDPDVASLLSITEMRGAFLSVSGNFPILNYGCALRVGVSAGVAMWYFEPGPTFGGKLVAGAYGEAACIVSVKGQLTLIGGKDPSGYFFNGNAWVGGGIGFCDPEDWHKPSDVLNDSWCASCVAVIDLVYKNKDWSADYSVKCSL